MVFLSSKVSILRSQIVNQIHTIHKFYELNKLIDNTLKKCLAILILMCFFQLHSAYSQTLNLNKEGEKIVIYSDGSWRYFDEDDPNDRILYENSDLYTIEEKTEGDKKRKEKTVKTKKNKPKKATPSKNKGKEKVAKAPKSKNVKPKKPRKSTSRLGSVGQQNYKQKVRRKILQIRDQQNIAFEKERVANYATNKYEKELKLAKKRKLSKSEIARIERSYKTAKMQLKDARGQNKMLLKQRRAYETIQKKKSGGSLVKAYDSLAKKYDKDFKIDPPKNRESLAIKEKKKSKPKSKKPKVKKNRSVEPMEDESIRYSEDESITEIDQYDEAVSAPSAYTVSYPNQKTNSAKAAVPACAIAFKGKDSFSGKKRVDLEPSLLFSHTTEKMRRYFEEGDMIQCEAYLSAVAGGYKFVCIEVTVASETAQKSYGSIEKQGLLSLKLVDGTTINMYNNKTDNGSLDPLKKTVLYKAQYLIPNEHVKALTKTDIDKVRLVWSTGYEDYTIYETDFLINQLDCLDK